MSADDIHKTRQAALDAGIEAIREEGEAAVVTACQGPPVCDRTFKDGDDVGAGMADCPWCTRVTIYPDGREVWAEPRRA